MGRYVANVHGKTKFKYTHKAESIMRTTRDIHFSKDDMLPKGSIVYIAERRQGYRCIPLKPAYCLSQIIVITQCDALEQITVTQWQNLLN